MDGLGEGQFAAALVADDPLLCRKFVSVADIPAAIIHRPARPRAQVADEHRVAFNGVRRKPPDRGYIHPSDRRSSVASAIQAATPAAASSSWSCGSAFLLTASMKS